MLIQVALCQNKKSPFTSELTLLLVSKCYLKFTFQGQPVLFILKNAGDNYIYHPLIRLFGGTKWI